MKREGDEPSGINGPDKSAGPIVFWRALQQLHQWQRKHLPGTDTPQGMSLLIWLSQHHGNPRPIGRLYKECRSSEPSMRAVTKISIERGLAELSFDQQDDRRRLLSSTPKFRRVVKEYGQQLQRVGAALD